MWLIKAQSQRERAYTALFTGDSILFTSAKRTGESHKLCWGLWYRKSLKRWIRTTKLTPMSPKLVIPHWLILLWLSVYFSYHTRKRGLFSSLEKLCCIASRYHSWFVLYCFALPHIELNLLITFQNNELPLSAPLNLPSRGNQCILLDTVTNLVFGYLPNKDRH